MNSESSGWIGADSMNHWHGWGWQMVSLGNKAYAMGGYRDYCNDPWCPVDIAIEVMERYDGDTNQWTDVASYPLYIYNHCMAADEETGRIWVMGGQYRTGTYRNESHDWGELRYYEVALEFTCHSLSHRKSLFTFLRKQTISKSIIPGVNKQLAWHLEHEMAQATSCMWDC